MDTESQKQDVIARFGRWTAHNICLSDHVYTIDPQSPAFGLKVKRINQIIADITMKPLNTLRILDLACLEGGYALDLAMQGAEVVGIEGRERNIEKARFAQNVLGLTNVEFVQDDVRNLSVEKYGQFDVVLSLGILYHLTVPDSLQFIEQIYSVCRIGALIDTHISVSPEQSYSYKGETYRGRIFKEHETTLKKKEIHDSNAWSALENYTSFWFTRPSLYNALSHVGFTSVYEALNPRFPTYSDRVLLVALKGQASVCLAIPNAVNEPFKAWPETPDTELYPSQKGLEYPKQSRRIMKLKHKIKMSLQRLGFKFSA